MIVPLVTELLIFLYAGRGITRAEVHENRSNGGTIVRHVVVRDDHLSIRFPILSGLEIMRRMRATSRNDIRITVSLSLFLFPREVIFSFLDCNKLIPIYIYIRLFRRLVGSVFLVLFSISL